MQISYDFYSILPLFALFVSLSLAFRLLRYRPYRLGTSLIVLLFALAWWSLAAFIERNSLDLGVKIFWIKMTYFGITVLPIAWLTFALQYSNQERWLNRRNLVLLFIIPLTTLVMVWTNDTHHFMWNNIWLDATISPPVDAVTHGAWFWISAAYSYGLILMGTICLLRIFLKSSNLYRKQAGTLLVATLVPWAGNFLYIAGIGPFSIVDPTPLGFSITCLAFFWGISRFKLLNMMPIAHETVFKSMIDGVIVLDHQHCIVDINPSAEQIIGRNRSEVIGQLCSGILPAQVCLFDAHPDMTEKQSEIELGDGFNRRYYGVYFSSIQIRQNLKGYVILLHDETERKNIEAENRERAILETELIERKKSEKALRESEEKLRQMFKCITDGITVVDLNGTITEVSDKLLEMHGIKSEKEILGKTPLDLVAPADREKARMSVNNVPHKGILPRFEYSLLNFNGFEFPGEVRAGELKDAEGKLIGFISATTDITERKRAQESLRKSEEKYSTIVEKGNDGIIILQDGIIRFANSKMTQLSGYTIDETIGRSFLDFISEEYRAPTLDRYKRRLKGEQLSSKYEITILTKNGSITPVEINANLIEYDGRTADLAVIRDITERKKAEEILKSSEAKFRNLVENAASGILVSVENGRIIHANKAAMEIYGYTSQEELELTSILDRYVEIEDRNRLLENIQAKGIVKGFETQMRRKDGSSFWVSINLITQINESGETQFISIIEEITDRKKAEAELARVNEELKIFNSQLEIKVEERTRQLGEAVVEAQASNQAKSDFLASMSHELRTPLNAIIGFSQVLDAQYFGHLNDKQSEYTKDILDSGKHLLSLINDILDLSKIEAGKMDLGLSRVKVADILRNSLVMIKEKAQAHNINIEVKIAEEIEKLEMEADERKLKQVMFNLLSNATKFTPDKGIIRVEARKEKGELFVSVSDTGIGISAKEKPRLFEAFYQASGGLKDKTPGTGLGLKITRSIIEKHGGRIWVESEGPGRGSRFSFILPIRELAKVKS
jgi:PAS domain S-box-containing protein